MTPFLDSFRIADQTGQLPSDFAHFPALDVTDRSGRLLELALFPYGNISAVFGGISNEYSRTVTFT